MSVYKYALPVIMDGFTAQTTIDVGSKMLDARTAIWSLYGPDSTEQVGVIIVPDSSHVQLSSSLPFPAGSYMLVGLA